MGPSAHGEQPRQTESSLVSPCLSGTMVKIPHCQRQDPLSPRFDHSSRQKKVSKKWLFNPRSNFLAAQL